MTETNRRPLVVYDDGKGELSPMTDLRAVFDVRTGALTNLERIEAVLGRPADALLTSDALADLTRERHEAPVNELPAADALLAVSGACVALPAGAAALSPGEALVDEAGRLLAACAPPDAVEGLLTGASGAGGLDWRIAEGVPVLRRVWDVIRHRDAALAHDLSLLAAKDNREAATGAGAAVIGERVVSVAPTATIQPGVALNAEKGAIVVGDGAEVRAGAIVVGPAYVGKGAAVLEHALVKANTAIGPVCKVAGEVGGTIFQGFANKGHDGHLGDSWIGEWVNFGAGTVNSNLLNTYGEVSMRTSPSGGRRERTGLTFVGAVFGDHVKTAIATRVMTGGLLGTGAMIASSTPVTDAAPFEWRTDAGRQTFRLAKFMDTVRAVMLRRGVEPRAAYEARLAALHEAAMAAAAARA